jgi:hypothetical protein
MRLHFKLFLLRIYSVRNVVSATFILLMLFCSTQFVNAAHGIASTGNWNNSTSWLINGVARTPDCGDTLHIPSGVVVTVNNQNDYTDCSSGMVIIVQGTLQFTNGNKLDLSCNSTIDILPGGLVKKSTAGGGSSTRIKICSCVSWTAGDGPANGPEILSCSNGTLPITLLSFTAETIENKIELRWITSSEINNKYFTLERSADGIEFLPVTTIPAAGNSTELNYYLYEDLEPMNNISYYRLKQSDTDGKFSYSDIIVIKFSSKNLLKIISCSVDNSKTMDLIYFEMNKTTTSLFIFDMSGKTIYETKIYSIKGMNHVKLDVPFYDAGWYYLSLSNGIVTETKKIFYGK